MQFLKTHTGIVILCGVLVVALIGGLAAGAVVLVGGIAAAVAVMTGRRAGGKDKKKKK